MLVLASAVVAAVMAVTAQAALFFLFKPTAAKPGDLVTVRLGGTPANLTLAQREKPFQKPIRVYLVPNRVVGDVSSRFDPRLHFIGRIVPDRNSRGLLAFRVPPLDTNDYVVAYWCPGCARYSFGRTFGVQTIPEVSRYRRLMGLRVEMPDPKDACSVTIPNATSPPPGLAPSPRWHTNGFLWTGLPEDGVFSRGNMAPDGSIWTKWIWFAAGVDGEFRVRLERLDAPSAPVVAQTVRGWAEGFRGTASWAARVGFTNPGCWRITGRVGDISLSYVVKVVASS